MKMHRISATTIAEAMAKARKDLGDEAVLLETKKVPKGVIVTFAVDQPDEALFEPEDAYNDNMAGIPAFSNADAFRSVHIPKPAAPKIELNHPALELIDEALTYHGVPDALRARLVTTLDKIRLKPDSLIEVAQNALCDALTENIPFKAIATAAKTVPEKAIMLVGPHGAGKTSTIAKLATELTLQKQKIVLISTDMERMGGTDSLQKLASILKCDFYICQQRSELKTLLNAHLGKAWVLIDSAGANIYEFAPMKAIGEYASLQGVEPILVCPAGMDADEAQEMAGVFDFLNIKRMIVTRLDAVRRLKGVFAVLSTGGYALSNLSNSAIPTDSCQPLSPIALSRLMLRHARERLTH